MTRGIASLHRMSLSQIVNVSSAMREESSNGESISHRFRCETIDRPESCPDRHRASPFTRFAQLLYWMYPRYTDKEVQRDIRCFRSKSSTKIANLASKLISRMVQKFFSRRFRHGLTKMKETASLSWKKSKRSSHRTRWGLPEPDPRGLLPYCFQTCSILQWYSTAGWRYWNHFGLNVARIINEPTQQQSYGLDKREKYSSLILVVAPSTFLFSPSIMVFLKLFQLVIPRRYVALMHVDGWSQHRKKSIIFVLFREDFDRIMEYFIKLIRRNTVKTSRRMLGSTSSVERRSEQSALCRTSIRLVKLSRSMMAWLLRTSPERFEELNNDLFRKTIGPVRRRWKMGWKDTDWRNSPCRGSTRIPKVQALWKSISMVRNQIKRPIQWSCCVWSCCSRRNTFWRRRWRNQGHLTTWRCAPNARYWNRRRGDD